MKTAVCISGLSRSYKETYTLFKENILDQLPGEYDIFISTWETEDILDIKDLYKPTLIKTDPNIPEDLKWYEEWKNFYTRFPNNSDANPGNTVPMLYKVKDCMQMVEGYSKTVGVEYDFVIRTRFDIIHSTPLNLYQLLSIQNKNYLGIHNSNVQHEPGWLYDGFAFGNWETMKIYSNLYDNLLEQAQKSNSWVIHEILRDYTITHQIPTLNPDNMIGMLRQGQWIIFFTSNYPQNVKDIAWNNLDKI